MRTFKHIPTGDVVSEVESKSGYYRNIYIPDGQLICGKYIIGCKDWQEIEEKKPEWTILNIRSKKHLGNFILNNNGKYSWENLYDNGTVSFKDLLKDTDNYIYSVRRESDGEVFTVGDSICFNKHQPTAIANIEVIKLLGNTIQVEGKGGNWSNCLQYVFKVKPKEWEITSFRAKDAPVFYNHKGNDNYFADGTLMEKYVQAEEFYHLCMKSIPLKDYQMVLSLRLVI